MALGPGGDPFPMPFEKPPCRWTVRSAPSSLRATATPEAVAANANTRTKLICVPSRPIACLPNDLPFSSERRGRVRAYHGREESRAQPAASRHDPTLSRTGLAFGCCNGLLDGRNQQQQGAHHAPHDGGCGHSSEPG